MEYMSITTIILLTAILLFAYRVFRHNSGPPKSEPPSISGLDLCKFLLNSRQTPRTTRLIELSKKYGCIFTLNLGFRKVVILTGWKIVKEAFNQDVFSEKNVPQIVQDIGLHHGLVFGRGESLKEMRHFTLTNLKEFGMGRKLSEEKIQEELEHLIDVFERKQGKPFDTSESMCCAVSNVINCIVFGSRFEYGDPIFRQMVENVSTNSQLLVCPQIQAYNHFPWLFSRTKSQQQLIKNSFSNRSHLTKLIRGLQETLEPHMSRCLVDSFLLRKVQLEASGKMYSHYHEDNLLATVINLFAGGTESTSSTLRYALLLMAKYPKIQDKVQEELDSVIGSRPVCGDDGRFLQYTQAVIYETQRLLSVFPMSVRCSSHDVTLNDCLIKKGTQVAIITASAHYDEDEWETPFRFNPTHFLTADGNLRKRDAFFPFNEGSRNCVGQSLAKMNMFLFFSSLLQNFRFTLKPGVREEDLDLMLMEGLALTPKAHELCAIRRF